MKDRLSTAAMLLLLATTTASCKEGRTMTAEPDEADTQVITYQYVLTPKGNKELTIQTPPPFDHLDLTRPVTLRLLDVDGTLLEEKTEQWTGWKEISPETEKEAQDALRHFKEHDPELYGKLIEMGAEEVR